MRGVRKHLIGVLLLVSFSGAVVATPTASRDDSAFGKIKKFIVHVLEDVRMGFPPG